MYLVWAAAVGGDEVFELLQAMLGIQTGLESERETIICHLVLQVPAGLCPSFQGQAGIRKGLLASHNGCQSVGGERLKARRDA